jgi:hypothetical protein
MLLEQKPISEIVGKVEEMRQQDVFLGSDNEKTKRMIDDIPNITPEFRKRLERALE